MLSEMDASTKPILARPPRKVMAASAVVFLIATATITAALAFEYFGGYAPCPLCLQERYAYYFAVPASAVAFLLAHGYATRFARILLLLIAVAFLVNAVAGVYHSGIEWKWWQGPSTCAGGTPIEWGEGGLAQELENVQLIRCDEAPWRFLMLSFAGWSAVISAFLAGVAAWGAAQKR
jgi:disulfide bond formation protein DsbB